MAALPVWHIEAGLVDASGDFQCKSMGSAVMVGVRKSGEHGLKRMLLTAQHVLRSGEDQRSGSYHPEIRARAAWTLYHPDEFVRVSLFSDLAPDPVAPLKHAENLAFLELPADRGDTVSNILDDASCEVGLKDITICGYPDGDAATKNNNYLEPVEYPDWRYTNTRRESGVGILTYGDASPPPPGVGGGGIFHHGHYAGIYLGKFNSEGELFFLPIQWIRRWCIHRGYELVSDGELSRLVMAFGMDDDDIALATKLMSPEKPGNTRREPVDSSGGSFIIGEATPEEIESMTEAGLTVYVLSAPTPAPRPESTAVDRPDTEGIDRKPYVMWLRGPLTPNRSSQLEKHGLLIRDALPSGSILVDLTPAAAKEVARLSFIREFVDLDQLSIESRSELLRHAPLVPPGLIHEPVMEGLPKKALYDLFLFPETNPEAYKEELAGAGIEAIGSSGRKVRILAYEHELERLPPVEVMELYISPVLHNLHAARVMRVVAMQDDHRTLRWDGSGEVVAMADTGLDDTHPAFNGRIHGLVALGRPGLTDDPHGHGTHVAGSILGNGTSRNPAIDSLPLPAGTAPGATLFCQSLLGNPIPTNPYPLSGLDSIISLGDLFEPAYQAGARIHNNSWGGVAKSLYRLHSQEVDEYVANRRDMLVVISAGNDGSTRDPLAPVQRFSAAGFVDWYSLCAPATSKNALTVGASRSSITAGGYSTLAHKDAFSDSFPPTHPPTVPDIATELVSGNSNDLAGFSSRGPTDTLQIKPDLVAPGTDIVSARSISAPAIHYSGPFAGNKDYAHMCGTSMAAPLVSGCAAVVRQYYKEVHHYDEPSAALIKATLINGTRVLEGPHANAIPGGFPNGHQGFGCIDMATTLPATEDAFAFHYYDNWLTSPDHLSNSPADRYRDFTFTFDPAPEIAPSLRVSLVHTDPPGRSVINVLQLRMQYKDATGKRTDWHGNAGQQTSLLPALPLPFRNNNVAIIRPLNPRPGTYKIRVELINLLKGPTQDFALVVTGTGITAWSPPAAS